MSKKQKPKILDGATIILILVLTGLIFAISGILAWKEGNIETSFKFTDNLGGVKTPNEIIGGDKMIIHFSGPVQAESVSDNLIIEPKLSFDYQWLSGHSLQVTVQENLRPGTNYVLKVENFKSKWGLNNESVKKVFSTDPLPVLKTKEVFPKNEDDLVDVKPGIKYEFEQPLAEQYFLKIKTEPHFKVKTVKNKNKRNIILEPLDNLKFGTHYSIKASIKSNNYLNFNQEIQEIKFKTKKPPTVVYGWDSNGAPTRIEIQTEVVKPSVDIGRYIDIDLTKQNLYIFEDGEQKGAYKISTGIRGMETPIGKFEVIARAGRPWSDKYGLFMPWFIQFTNEGHGIHELPEWPGGYKEGANHLGVPVSHGCVRLGIGPAKKVYDFVKTGTPLVIHY